MSLNCRTRSHRKIAAVAASLIVAAVPAAANDATAEIGVGGLQLIYNPAIEMAAENLVVSRDEVRVDYVFRNVTKAPVTVTVAFPLPPVPGGFENNIVLPNDASENYVNFALTVDGVPIEPQVYSRAVSLGIDRTEILRTMGIPLTPTGEATFTALDALSAASQRELARLGLIVLEDWGLVPMWTLETAFYWEQTFPAGAEVAISHRYEPVVGYGFFGDFAFDDPIYRERYCLDDDFIAAARRLMGNDPNFQILNEQRIEYVLTTANTWASPIRDFTLTVDKGSPDALVSFCGEGVTRTSDTTFEDRETDFYPLRELDVLIVTRIQP
ncbi:MAG: DUF4424 domain-containing protein [Bauldia sp.]|nr:DUF4424 domain-containing protein [Bauldia sp.]